MSFDRQNSTVSIQDITTTNQDMEKTSLLEISDGPCVTKTWNGRKNLNC